MAKLRQSIQMNPQSHRVLRYVLKIGDMEEATHVFVDLLEMTVLSYHEFTEGSADGDDVHYEGAWSKTIVGYSDHNDVSNPAVSIQLTKNQKINKYERGNHFQAIEIQLAKTDSLEAAGVPTEVIRGQKIYTVTVDGYNVQVAKSQDGRNRVSRVILSTDESISLAGRVVRFWTECLHFNIISWSSYSKEDEAMHKSDDTCCACCFPWQDELGFTQLRPGEQPYVELQYGGNHEFYVRLQKLRFAEKLVAGAATERLILTCPLDRLNQLTRRVNTIGRFHGGRGVKKEYQMVPNQKGLNGVVVNDPGGLEVCFFNDNEMGPEIDNHVLAETRLREALSTAKAKRLASKRSTVTFHMKKPVYID